MVKTRFLPLLGCVVMFCSCGMLGRTEKANPEVLQLAQGKLGSDASLVQTGGDLVAIFSDWETTGLYEVKIPVSDHLPTTAPSANMIDKIDVALPLSQSFGRHLAVASENTITVLYAARASEDKMILKVATRDADESAWTVDAVEPPGDPMAILPLAQKRVDLFWAAGALLHATYPAAGPAETLLDPFTPAGRGAAFGPSDSPEATPAATVAWAQRGVTVYDSGERSLFLFRWNGSSYDRVRVDGAGPVHSSLLLSDGTLAVLTWDPATRRLELLVQDRGGVRLSRSLVTLSEETSTVALLPPSQASGRSPDGSAFGRTDRVLFLYDDTRRLGGGRVLHELCLLVPGSGWGPVARKYRKIILVSGPEPILDFSPVERAERLYVLVRQDGLKLLALTLPK